MQLNRVSNVNFKGMAVIVGSEKDAREIAEKTGAIWRCAGHLDTTDSTWVMATDEADIKTLKTLVTEVDKEMGGFKVIDTFFKRGDRKAQRRYFEAIFKKVEGLKLPEFNTKNVLEGLRNGTFDAAKLVFKTK